MMPQPITPEERPKQEYYACEIIPTYKKIRKIKSSLTDDKKMVAFIRKQFPNKSICHFESFGVVYLDMALNVVGVKISEGGISGTLVDIRLIFQKALLCNASKFVVFHNHPSGSLTPSKADVRISKKLAQAGEVMDIEMLDSLIITEKTHLRIDY